MDAQSSRRTVVVGVDGSEHALRAVRWGAAEAGRRQIPLRLMIAFGWRDDAGRPGLGQRYRDRLLEISRGHLTDAAAVAVEVAAGIDVEQQLVVGSPIAVLGDEARRARVLVVGERGLGQIEGLLVGSVATSLAAHAPCPVVVVRGVERMPSDVVSMPVVVGVHGSGTSDAAVEFAFQAAAARRVSVVAVRSWWEPVWDPGLSAMIFNWKAIEADEGRFLAQDLAGWTEKYPEVFVEHHVTRDLPARSLLEQAADAQLVVVGSRGRGVLSSLVLGSVGNALLHRSPCPVAVVRPGTGSE